MEQIFIANPKGGCGKTTLSTHLSACLSVAGKRVLLVDHDALRCSSDWLKSRPLSVSKIRSVIADADAYVDPGDAEFVVHDMPAAWTLENVQTILHTHDKVIVPVLSSPNDIKACLRYIMMLHRSGILELGVQLGLVANRVRVNTRYFKILREFLTRLDLPLVTVLRDTQNYVKVMDEGLSIFDLPPGSAAKDIDQWRPLIEWVTQREIYQHQHLDASIHSCRN